jgi:hypothetical protein
VPARCEDILWSDVVGSTAGEGAAASFSAQDSCVGAARLAIRDPALFSAAVPDGIDTLPSGLATQGMSCA